jgi:hypothetical protein
MSFTFTAETQGAADQMNVASLTSPSPLAGWGKSTQVLSPGDGTKSGGAGKLPTIGCPRRPIVNMSTVTTRDTTKRKE